MMKGKINFDQKMTLINEHWSPRVAAEMNDYQFKLVKLLGDFIWHKHEDTDETFIVIKGKLRIDIEPGHIEDDQVELNPGEMIVIPKGVSHKPYAEQEVEAMLIEPKGVTNTGDNVESDRTAENDVWI